MKASRLMFAFAAAGVVLAGCSKLTFDHYQMVYDGQGKDGVRNTLGDPFEDTGNTFIYYDADRQINASVYFDDDGNTIGKEWHDPEHGQHGDNPRVNEPGDAEQIKVRKIE